MNPLLWLRVNHLINLLWSDKQADRDNAANKLSEIGAPAVELLLVALAKDDRNYELADFENVDLRRAIIQIGEPSFEALLRSLYNKRLARAAAKLLAQWGDRRAVGPLTLVLQDPSTDLNDRLYIIDALGVLRNHEAYEALRAALLDKDLMVRSHAAYAIAEFGNLDDIPTLEAALAAQDFGEQLYFREGLRNVLELLRNRHDQKMRQS